MVTPDKKIESSSAEVVRSFIPRDALCVRLCVIDTAG
jgi:hypothetical protein